LTPNDQRSPRPYPELWLRFVDPGKPSENLDHQPEHSPEILAKALGFRGPPSDWGSDAQQRLREHLEIASDVLRLNVTEQWLREHSEIAGDEVRLIAAAQRLTAGRLATQWLARPWDSARWVALAPRVGRALREYREYVELESKPMDFKTSLRTLIVVAILDWSKRSFAPQKVKTDSYGSEWTGRPIELPLARYLRLFKRQVAGRVEEMLFPDKDDRRKRTQAHSNASTCLESLRPAAEAGVEPGASLGYFEEERLRYASGLASLFKAKPERWQLGWPIPLLVRSKSEDGPFQAVQARLISSLFPAGEPKAGQSAETAAYQLDHLLVPAAGRCPHHQCPRCPTNGPCRNPSHEQSLPYLLDHNWRGERYRTPQCPACMETGIDQAAIAEKVVSGHMGFREADARPVHNAKDRIRVTGGRGREYARPMTVAEERESEYEAWRRSRECVRDEGQNRYLETVRLAKSMKPTPLRIPSGVRLTPTEARVWRWRAAGFSARETADRMRTTPGAVDVHFSNARKKVRAWLGDEDLKVSAGAGACNDVGSRHYSRQLARDELRQVVSAAGAPRKTCREELDDSHRHLRGAVASTR